MSLVSVGTSKLGPIGAQINDFFHSDEFLKRTPKQQEIIFKKISEAGGKI